MISVCEDKGAIDAGVVGVFSEAARGFNSLKETPLA